MHTAGTQLVPANMQLLVRDQRLGALSNRSWNGLELIGIV